MRKLSAVLFGSAEIGLWVAIGYYWKDSLWQSLVLMAIAAILAGALDRTLDRAAQ